MFITFTVKSFKFMDAHFPSFKEKMYFRGNVNLWIFCYCQHIYMWTGLHKPQLKSQFKLNWCINLLEMYMKFFRFNWGLYNPVLIWCHVTVLTNEISLIIDLFLRIQWFLCFECFMSIINNYVITVVFRH